MKYLLRLLVFAVIGFISYGYFYKNNGSAEGDKWIGVGVLTLALVLMPVFIFHRYRKKDLKEYMFKTPDENSKSAGNQ